MGDHMTWSVQCDLTLCKDVQHHVTWHAHVRWACDACSGAFGACERACDAHGGVCDACSEACDACGGVHAMQRKVHDAHGRSMMHMGRHMMHVSVP